RVARVSRIARDLLGGMIPSRYLTFEDVLRVPHARCVSVGLFASSSASIPEMGHFPLNISS
ncbi:MAG: hypothetical protein ACRD4X_07010, partial [Candidatus Acidiferrales bacterium]